MSPPTTRQAFHFGAFSLYPASRLLLEDGQPVRLGARALDLLIALVERAGEVIPKEELFRRVWPSTIVEETSLRVHIGALRKALGGPDSRYIANIPGQGYAFTGELDRKSPDPVQPLPSTGRLARAHLPVRLTRMIGRGDASAGVATALLTQRFVTITGEGGVGKTTLALAIAEGTLDEYPDGAAFVDLATCASPALLVSTVGRAIGQLLPADTPVQALCEALRGQRFLLLMDNCEHLVADAAGLVAELLGRLPALRILATSREPLRAEGEQVHRLETLPVPPPAPALTAEQALGFEAIQLLVERVSAATDGFVLTDADAAPAAELCRRLDGIPLAIELAAARVGFFGLRGLLERLPQRLQILTSGHRTVMPRHQTLRALYDWSYDLLDSATQQALARLAVFPGSFSLESALALMAGGDRASALAMLLDLIAKSLVATDLGEERRRYRLLDTARVYAMEKLVDAGALADARRTHATHLVRQLQAANAEWEHVARRSWLARHGPATEDARAVLAWAGTTGGEADGGENGGEDGDLLLYAHLVEASFLLCQELSQLEWLRPHLEQALRRLLQRPQRLPDLERQLTVLQVEALCQCRPQPGQVDDWLARARPFLEQPESSPAMLFATSVTYLAHGEYRQMLKGAERLELLAEYAADPDCIIGARRLQAQAHHFLGQLGACKRLAREVARHPKPRLRIGVHLDTLDRRISMGILLARTAWLEGDSASAWQQVQVIEDLVQHEMEHGQCQVLALASVPVALWDGDLERARASVQALRQLTGQARLGDYWKEWGLAFSDLLAGRPLPPATQCIKLLDLLGTLDPSLHDERLLARALHGPAGWSAAEVLRHHGERLKAQDPGQAERLFARALGLAADQGATRWELRAAMSLARLSVAQGRRLVQETALLAPLARLAPGTGPADVMEARRCLEALAQLRRDGGGGGGGRSGGGEPGELGGDHGA